MTSETPAAPLELRERIRRTRDRAATLGKLEPIATSESVLEDGGIPFVVHHLGALPRKSAAGERQRARGTNPFLPVDPDMLVCDLGATHRCILNKFPIVDSHVVLATREFVPQHTLLSADDFSAAWRCLRELDGLVFYNSDATAGASQPHKHLQLVPVPIGDGPLRTPVDVRIQAGGLLPFAHARAPLDLAPETPPEEAGRRLATIARRLRHEVGLGDRTDSRNLVMTREWMMIVPRRRARCDGVAINAMGFAGTLLVRDEKQQEALVRRGPLAILTQVAGLRDDAPCDPASRPPPA